MENNYNNGGKFCSKCGNSVKLGSTFCQNCGSQINAPQVSPIQPNPPVNPVINQTRSPYYPTPVIQKKSGKGPLVVFLILFIILSIALVICSLIFYGNMKDSQYTANYYRSKYIDIADEYEFYHEYAVIQNSDDDTIYYHQYGCKYLDTSNFHIYNKKLADSQDAKPCPFCIGNE